MGLSLNSEDGFLEDFFSKHPSRTLPKNRPLLYQGEVPAMVFFIKSGVVKLYNITSQGEERTVSYVTDGFFLPTEWIFDKAPVALYYYDTFTDCEIYRIPKDELIEVLNQNPKAARALLDRAMTMYLGATMHLHALEQSKARQKLLYIMQYLTLRFGKKIDESRSKIDLRLTHQEIANLIGITRETVSSEISKLAKEGVLKVTDSTYVINTDKAIRILGDDDFKELSL